MSYGNPQIYFLLRYLDHFIIDKAVIFSAPNLCLKRHSAWLETKFFFLIKVLLQMSLIEVTKIFIQVAFSCKYQIMD